MAGEAPVPWLRSPAESCVASSFGCGRGKGRGRGRTSGGEDASDRGRLQWDEPRDMFLLGYLVQAASQRKQLGSGGSWLSKDIWEDLKIKFNESFCDGVSVEQLKYRRENLKRMYNVVQRLKEREDMEWDGDSLRFHAREEVWRQLCGEDPRVGLIKGRRNYWLPAAIELFEKKSSDSKPSPGRLAPCGEVAQWSGAKADGHSPAELAATPLLTSPEGDANVEIQVGSSLHAWNQIPASKLALALHTGSGMAVLPDVVEVKCLPCPALQENQENYPASSGAKGTKREHPTSSEGERDCAAKRSQSACSAEYAGENAGVIGSALIGNSAHDPLSKALAMLQEEKQLSDEEKLQCVDLFLSQEKLATAYCALKGSLRVMWLRKRLQEV